MAIGTYSELQAACSSFAGGSSDTAFADAIRTSIALCESDIERQLRAPELIVRRTGVVGSAWEVLPDDFMKLISLSLICDDAETVLAQIPEDAATAYALRYPSGTPRWFAIVGTELRLIPAPDEDCTDSLRMVYQKKVPRLSDDAPTNDLLTAFPDLYLWGSLSVLGEYIEDSARLPRFEQRFQNAIKAINKMSVLRDGTLVG
jgi:hypothetical protein